MICVLLVLFTWCFTGFMFLKLPAIIPIHFDGDGKVNNYGTKDTLLIIPVINTVLFLLLTKLAMYPHIFNYMVRITEENAFRQYTIATKMLRFLKLAILLICAMIMMFIYLSILGIIRGPGPFFIPFIFGILLIPTIYGLIAAYKKK